MAAVLLGLHTWSGDIDSEGHRTYKLVWRIRTLTSEGPATVFQCPGLPTPGSLYLISADVDLWAWCLQGLGVRPEKEGEQNEYWRVEQSFSTKPPSSDKQRCNTNPIEDPLLEPPKIGGSFVQKTEEGIKDRFGNPITTSSHEQIRGQSNEWDADGGDSVNIEMNVADLNLGLLAQMKNWLNDAPLWGLPSRCIKFSRYTWGIVYNGSCSHYYTWHLEFEVNRNGFDRDLLDEGTKALKGHWDIRGSGCTLNITTSGGAITAATITAGGTGYVKSGTVNLIVTGGGGTGGVVRVTTNPSGVVTGVSSVAQGGAGYSNTAAAATRAEAGGWILDDIDGSPPDPKNPSHFIRFTDPSGNLARVILNGEGIPFDAATATSFVDDGFPNGTGAPPGSNTSGVGVPSGLTATLLDRGALGPGDQYQWVVTATTAAGESTPSAASSTITTTADKAKVKLTWNLVTGAKGYKIYRKKLTVDPNFVFISKSSGGAEAGKIHVQKYDQGNLLLLGIPTVLA
jgi:hypothetical protein